MSSAGATIPAPQTYFCYQCNRTVTLSPSPNSDLSCPNCHGGFLEEFDSSSSNPNPNPSSLGFPDPFSLFSDHPFLSPSFSDRPIVFSSSSIGLRNPRTQNHNQNPSSLYDSPGGFNAFDFLQSYLQNLTASGANVQFVVENHPAGSETGFRLPANLGDYFLGPGLEQLIQQLAENDPNRYGTPPASKRSVQELPSVVIDEELMKSDSNSCAVCMSEFEVGLEVKKMPCAHLYHADCLLPWLELHNSCPVCRYELPTDDPDYENRKGNSRGQGSSSSSSSGGEGNGNGNGNGGDSQGGGGGAERRFRISLPWPFSSFGGGSGDGAGGGGGGGDNDGQGSQPWYDGLD